MRANRLASGAAKRVRLERRVRTPREEAHVNEYYRGKIKVVGADLMCFPADPLTLDALACGSYDPWAISDPDTTPVETISCGEWNKRRADRRDQEQRDYYLRQAGSNVGIEPHLPATEER